MADPCHSFAILRGTPTMDLPILLQENMWTNPGNLQIAHRHLNVEIVTEAVQFSEEEYINGIFVAVH
jgi:hypothetical protein